MKRGCLSGGQLQLRPHPRKWCRPGVTCAVKRPLPPCGHVHPNGRPSEAGASVIALHCLKGLNVKTSSHAVRHHRSPVCCFWATAAWGVCQGTLEEAHRSVFIHVDASVGYKQSHATSVLVYTSQPGPALQCCKRINMTSQERGAVEEKNKTKHSRGSGIYRALDGGIRMTEITLLKALTSALCRSHCELWDLYVSLFQNTRNLYWNCFVLGQV